MITVFSMTQLIPWNAWRYPSCCFEVLPLNGTSWIPTMPSVLPGRAYPHCVPGCPRIMIWLKGQWEIFVQESTRENWVLCASSQKLPKALLNECWHWCGAVKALSCLVYEDLGVPSAANAFGLLSDSEMVKMEMEEEIATDNKSQVCYECCGRNIKSYITFLRIYRSKILDTTKMKRTSVDVFFAT